MNECNEIYERLVALEVEIKTKDREIKELKEKVELLNTAFNTQALTIQDIRADVGYMRKEFETINKFIEELKMQPKKELNKFIGYILAALCGSIIPIMINRFIK